MRFFLASYWVWCLREYFLVRIKSVRTSRLQLPCKVLHTDFTALPTLCFICLEHCPPHSLNPHLSPSRLIAVQSTDPSFYVPSSPKCEVLLKLSSSPHTLYCHTLYNMETVSPFSPWDWVNYPISLIGISTMPISEYMLIK